jgi:hypothetical protein
VTNVADFRREYLDNFARIYERGGTRLLAGQVVLGSSRGVREKWKETAGPYAPSEPRSHGTPGQAG